MAEKTRVGNATTRLWALSLIRYWGFSRGTCVNLCLGIDVSKSKQEELDIYAPMPLCTK